MFKEFKEFIMRGNVMEIAIGFIIGGAFGAIAKSMVTDVLMPPVGLLLGGVDFSNFFIVLKQGKVPAPYNALADAQAAGAVTISYGVFLNTVISFLIISLAVFILVKAMNKLKREEAPAEPTTKECPHCFSTISTKATKCPQCTSVLT
ncbi:MAG: large conductance mechanosensitive channel protein MscL [Thermodesulfobacteriota bacterium]|jgi:large conductance mechanosensitive channel|nr:MAG: large conductance mechanosensitive channel protein MscL [Thermodesulfobacteriota bacterium]